MTCILACAPSPRAQTLPMVEQQQTNGDEQMLLEAETLTYDNDNQTVTTSGGVQIEYGGNKMVAERVIYDRKSGRLIATGDVQIIEKGKNKIYADEMDVTDDFRDGFLNALRIETPDKTYFAAESATREAGTLTTFNHGVYTACEPCEDKPGRPPIWRIRSQKIIWNGKEHTVRFRHARFEFFGMPIAYLPVFQTADPTVKRKSGFLFPSFVQDDERGVGVRIPYYFALSPTYDLTVAVTPYSKQGFLGEAEWRQQFNNGYYTLKVAGISQNSPDEWTSRDVDSTVTKRGMIGTKGRFQVNPRWAFGWDVLAQSDKNFSNTYEIEGFSDSTHRSEVYLTGLNDRNYFDLRAMHFDVQESILDNNPNNGQPYSSARDRLQANVLPSFDYSRTPDEPVAGGQLTLTANAQALFRSREQSFDPDADQIIPHSTINGIEGSSQRFTGEAEWKRSFTTDNGIVLTPLLALRGDVIGVSNDSISSINDFTINGEAVASDVKSAYYRYMATAGMEARWPILFSTSSSSHILEPMAQIFVRPDAPYQDTLGIPNEDAQSLVFDATSLFDRDKFAGYDRMEGGTRANLGLRYAGDFGAGWSVNALVGESFQLAGENPFDQPDLVNVGAYSGLESDRSDFVGLIGLQTPIGLSGSVGARFDEKTFEVRRTDLSATYSSHPLTASLQYAYIQKQPLYGFTDDRREVTAAASLRFLENWRLYGSETYDIENNTLSKNTIGFGYADECFTYLMSYTRKTNSRTGEQDQTIGFRISLRTIGDFGSDTGQFTQD